MKRYRREITTALILLVFLIGCGLLAYPTFSDWWNSFHQSRTIMQYSQAIANLNQEEYDRVWSEAIRYNEDMARDGIDWLMDEEQRKRYYKELDFAGNGTMGYVNIPKINVMLPVYHGTDDGILQTSIGHLEQTSLPVGGETAHSVLSGHRGLPSAKLFSELDALAEGDRFTLHILDQVLTYEVDRIRIVEPSDFSKISLEKGKDYCTLLTCTPYSVNTHRLLVRGHRVANDKDDKNIRITADAMQIDTIYVAPFVAAPVLLILFMFMMLAAPGPSKKTW